MKKTASCTSISEILPFPSAVRIAQILEALSNSDGMIIDKLMKVVNLSEKQLERALKILSVKNPSPVINRGTKWHRAPVKFVFDHDRYMQTAIQRENEWQDIQEYISEKKCLMCYLAKSLGDSNPEYCGKCSFCTGVPAVNFKVSRKMLIEATKFIYDSEIVLECKKRINSFLFKEYGFPEDQFQGLIAREGRVLSWWNDSGWGKIVAEGKHNNHFPDLLVDAVTKMINKWQPSPRPEWVTCVPSFTRPDLVPSFAKRLANK